MATEFKRSVLASVPTSSIPNTSNTNNDLYTVPANCDTVVIGLLLTNKTGSGITADVMIVVQSGQGANVYIVKDAQVPGGSALEVISGKIVVANTGSGTGDTVQVRCSAATSLDATISVLENT